MPREAKEEISRSISSTSTSVLDSISRCGSFGMASVLQQFHVTSTCCIFTFSFIGGICVLEFLQPFFLVKQCDPQSLKSGEKDLVWRWTCWFHQIFASSSSSRRKWARSFLAGFHPYIKKVWQEMKQSDREQFACANKISNRNLHYMWQLAVNFN